MEEKKQLNKFSRISKMDAALMIGVSVFYDTLELGVGWIPILGQILVIFINFFAIMHFSLWFVLKGVKIMTPKAVARYWAPQLFGTALPFIGFFLTTVGVVLMIGMTWTEDKTGINISKKGSKPKIAKK